MEAVSYTAQWTAAARALESERDDNLFSDRFARELAGDVGFNLLDRYSGAGTVPFLAIRTRFLDDTITATITERGIRQVVFVAAGMDTRYLRLDWPGDVTLYELDRPALFDVKERSLPMADASSGLRRHTVGVDLAGDWVESARAAGLDPTQPTLWMAEGLFFFLEERAVRCLLSTLSELSAPGSLLAGDLASHASLTNPLAQTFLRTLAEDGSPWKFGTDHPEEFLAECEWAVHDLKQPGEDGASFGRWPYPVVPRELSHVPRSFLFTADVAGSDV